MRRWLLWTLSVGALLLALVIGGGGWWLRGSLALLDGEVVTAGLSAPVSIERDALGVPRITGASRNDIAFALGFLHAQERFFQMDLARRNSAGELSELFGGAALGHDQRVRAHRFRWRAAGILASATPAAQVLLASYANGVNAGLARLHRPPFEYALLRSTPRDWQAEDSLLVIFSMFLVLQDEEARFERGLGLMADVLPPDLYQFFSQQGGQWDAPLEGEALPAIALPASSLVDLLAGLQQPVAYESLSDSDLLPGSNNWAVAGALTAHGGALVANDMHLPLDLPNIWYRAAWMQPDTGQLVSGVTLPGVPQLVAGSNGRVAWGFTNTQGDWSDVILLQTDDSGERYLAPGGYEPFVTIKETIQVKGAEPQQVRVMETRWGPVIGSDHQGRLLALRWVAHEPIALGMGTVRMETVGSVAQALALGPIYGVPHQNLVVGDEDGAIGWTVAGAIPRRVGLDGVLPQRWDQAGRGWDGFLDETQHPRRQDPPGGRIWTANARVLSGADYALLGSEGAALGARQQQIRDGLLARQAFTETDMLAIQLDDRAVFLGRWRQRLLDLLDAQALDGQPARAQALEHARAWSGHAAQDDVGYRIVREFRNKAIELSMAPLGTLLQAHDPEFRLHHVARQFEYPAWALLEARPAHLLNPDYPSWQALELAALDQVLEPLWTDKTLANDSWGKANRLQIHHPMAGALPALTWWLSMPDVPVDGDSHMPRVQSPRFGASERFAVAPGRESEGYFHMATGQSAHPLSPFFGKGHEDWLLGLPSPWLPGPAEYRLRLLPP